MSLRTERHDRVVVLTMDSPPANAMHPAGLDELSDAVDAAAGDNDVDAIVITAAGRAFSAGLDLKAIQGADAGAQETLIDALNRCFLTVYSCPKLVVGAINGHAIAGGLVLALCCDVRLVADTPLRAALAEVSVGVAFPLGALEVVRNELAGATLRRFVLRGEVVDAATGTALGVFDRVVPADELLDAALQLAADTRPPTAFATIKAQLRAPAIATMRAALGGGDPVPRPWLTDESFAAAAAALARG